MKKYCPGCGSYMDVNRLQHTCTKSVKHRVRAKVCVTCGGIGNHEQVNCPGRFHDRIMEGWRTCGARLEFADD